MPSLRLSTFFIIKYVSKVWDAPPDGTVLNVDVLSPITFSTPCVDHNRKESSSNVILSFEYFLILHWLN